MPELLCSRALPFAAFRSHQTRGFIVRTHRTEPRYKSRSTDCIAIFCLRPRSAQMACEAASQNVQLQLSKVSKTHARAKKYKQDIVSALSFRDCELSTLISRPQPPPLIPVP